MTLKLKIILRACLIRMARGEELETILTSYPALTPVEVETVRAEITSE